MANPGLGQAKNKVDAIVDDIAVDDIVKEDSLKKLRQYVNKKLEDVQALIKANPPSDTNVPQQYDLCVNGKVFARMVDGVIVPL